MRNPLSQGLPPPLGTEEPQLSQLLLTKGQAVLLLQKQVPLCQGEPQQARWKSEWKEKARRKVVEPQGGAGNNSIEGC